MNKLAKIISTPVLLITQHKSQSNNAVNIGINQSHNMLTVHLVFVVFLFKTIDLKTTVGETLVHSLNETDNSYNNTATFTISENLNVTAALVTIQMTTQKSSRNIDGVKAKKSSGPEENEIDKIYDEYSDFNGDGFSDEKVRLLLSPKEYLTLNRTQVRTIKVNPETSHVIHGQRKELFLSSVSPTNVIHQWNGSNDENAKNEAVDINIMKSNNVNKESNFSSNIKSIEVITINASEWDTTTEKNEFINIIRENNTDEVVSDTEKGVAILAGKGNEVAADASVSNVNVTLRNNLKFKQNNVENETSVSGDQFSTSIPTQESLLQVGNDPHTTNATSTVTEMNSMILNHINARIVQNDMQNSKNHNSISPSVKKSKNAIEIGSAAEKNNDNLSNETMNLSSRWDANSSGGQVLRSAEQHPGKGNFQEAFTVRNSSIFENSDDDFYEELDGEFEFDDEDREDDSDVEEYETTNPDGAIVIVLPGNVEKIDRKSSSMKSEVIKYDNISNSLLYLLTNLTVTTTINERNTKNILRELGHQKGQLRVLKNQYDTISNYLVKVTNSKHK